MKMKLTDPQIKGKFLAERAIRRWKEDFVSEDSGEIVPIERKELIAGRGTFLDLLTISLLQENGITEIEVSDERRAGTWNNLYTKYEVCAVVPRKINGREKAVNESYLIYANSISEAEKKAVDELEKSCEGVFKIPRISIPKIDMVIRADGDRWFLCSITHMDIDGKERKETLLVQGHNIDSASATIQHDEGLPEDYTISKITESNFVEVYDPEYPS